MSRSRSWLRRNAVFAALAVACLFMLATTDRFGTAQNLANILQQNALIGIIACGMTFAIVVGGFDLSVGSVAALSMVAVAGVLASVPAGGLPLALAAMGMVGLGAGALNGALVAYARINPFVATLGTMTIVRGVVFVATDAAPVLGVPFSYTAFGLGRSLGVPNVTWIAAGVALLLGLLLHVTRFGQHVFAVGGNARAAVVMGVDAARVRFLTYLLVGLCAALAGGLLVTQTASGQPQAAMGYELAAIAAVIVGGSRLGGGYGRMVGTIIGVLLLGVVSNGLNLHGVSPFWQPIATGLILVIAVGLDRTADDDG